ncbi:MAG: imidazole glycerol phosphate synthase cyclase subunit [Elusimicrobiota bacterium]|jgi:cyclase
MNAHGIRVIARLDIKGPNLVKGIHLEGLRIIGEPGLYARRYYEQGVDELLYMDIVASLYGRNSLTAIIERAAQDVFVPMTVGGGVRTLDDVRALLRAGADKVAVNTAAVRNPDFIRDAARSFGSQCIVVSIEAKLRGPDHWEVLTDNGRERTGRDAVEWAREAARLGAGELLVTSVDREGTGKGYDLALTRLISAQTEIPVIACGGAGEPGHLADAVETGRADAVCVASLLHYERQTVSGLKRALTARGIPVRTEDEACLPPR